MPSLPAARVTDPVVCPAFTALVPHVGGPIAKGAPTVLIAGLLAARLGDVTTCVGPPGAIASGSPVVLIAGQPAARMTDLAGHGGTITVGCPTVLIGGPAPPPPPPPPPDPRPKDEDKKDK
jgi:uncharacterized Zn-binding protein involved in type VI secretion